MSILEIKDLSFSYRKDKPLLKNISLCLESGEIFCLLGPNGSGKTTLMSQILFPTKENLEKIFVSRISVAQMSFSDRAKLFGYIPQKIGFPHISVLQTVVMGRYPHKQKFFLTPNENDIEVAFNALKQVGLEKLADRQLNTLSGGEVQRVFIAQSIAKEAKIYFFDEPMSALDPEYQRDFLKMILWLSDKGATIVFTTHNPNHLFGLNTKTRVGIIDQTHNFKEIDLKTSESIRNIEAAYNDSISISFNEYLKQYFAVFKW